MRKNIDWDNVALGSVPDSELAQQLGCTRVAVWSARKARGIAPAPRAARSAERETETLEVPVWAVQRVREFLLTLDWSRAVESGDIPLEIARASHRAGLGAVLSVSDGIYQTEFAGIVVERYGDRLVRVRILSAYAEVEGVGASVREALDSAVVLHDAARREVEGA
jgi:hypothetical protein